MNRKGFLYRILAALGVGAVGDMPTYPEWVMPSAFNDKSPPPLPDPLSYLEEGMHVGFYGRSQLEELEPMQRERNREMAEALDRMPKVREANREFYRLMDHLGA